MEHYKNVNRSLESSLFLFGLPEKSGVTKIVQFYLKNRNTCATAKILALFFAHSKYLFVMEPSNERKNNTKYLRAKVGNKIRLAEGLEKT